MWTDRVFNPGPLALESDALPTELRGPAVETEVKLQVVHPFILVASYVLNNL